ERRVEQDRPGLVGVEERGAIAPRREVRDAREVPREELELALASPLRELAAMPFAPQRRDRLVELRAPRYVPRAIEDPRRPPVRSRLAAEQIEAVIVDMPQNAADRDDPALCGRGTRLERRARCLVQRRLDRAAREP